MMLYTLIRMAEYGQGVRCLMLQKSILLLQELKKLNSYLMGEIRNQSTRRNSDLFFQFIIYQGTKEEKVSAATTPSPSSLPCEGEFAITENESRGR